MGPVSVLPNNGDNASLSAVTLHELGHAIGIMSKAGEKDDSSGRYTFGEVLSRYDSHLVDSFGNPAQASNGYREF